MNWVNSWSGVTLVPGAHSLFSDGEPWLKPARFHKHTSFTTKNKYKSKFLDTISYVKAKKFSRMNTRVFKCTIQKNIRSRTSATSLLKPYPLFKAGSIKGKNWVAFVIIKLRISKHNFCHIKEEYT